MVNWASRNLEVVGSIEDILAEYTIGRKYEIFSPRTIGRTDTSNSVNLYQEVHIDRNILAESYSTLHVETHWSKMTSEIVGRKFSTPVTL